MKIVFLQLMNVVFRWVSEGKINADPRQARLVQELQDLTERCQGYNPGLWGLKKHKSEKLERKQKSFFGGLFGKGSGSSEPVAPPKRQPVANAPQGTNIVT